MADVDITELEKQYAELGEMIEKLGGTPKYPCSDDMDMKAKVKKDRVPMKKKDDVLKAKSKAEDDDADDDDSEDDYEDDVAPAKTKKAAEAAEVKKVEADEEIVFKGQTIKKSAVGEIQFSIAKAMSEELTKNSEAIAKAQNEALLAKLEKQADAEFAHVPGSAIERAEMLKAIGLMDAELRKNFEAVFASAEKLAKAGFEKLGVAGGDSDNIKKNAEDFLTKVSDIQKRDGSKRAEAMTKARAEHPDLFKAYQSNN
jgi:hypothetical protein